MPTREQLLVLCGLAVTSIGFTAIHLGSPDATAELQQQAQRSRWQADQVAALRSEVAALRSELETVRAEAKDGDAAMHARISAAETTWSTTALAAVSGGSSGAAAPAAAAAGGLSEPPQPYTGASQGELHQDTMVIHGVRITYVVRNPGHLGLIQDHVSREVNGYALLKDAIEQAKARDPTATPLVMDVGSNHGLYSLFAAKLGADVITLEPQKRLCRVINKAAKLNGAEVASRITLYNNAALDAREVITLSQADIAEGAIATVVREGGGGGGSEKVEARPISDFVPKGDTRDVCFLKVDVEGFELHAIPSAGVLLDTGRVHNVVVEFGPPNRWGVAENSADDGVALLHMMQHKHGFEPRLINSLVWNEYLSRTDDAAKASAKDRQLVPLDSSFRHQEAVDAMARCCEAYVWFTRDVKAAFSTFSSGCGGDGNAVRGGDDVVQYGCDKSN